MTIGGSFTQTGANGIPSRPAAPKFQPPPSSLEYEKLWVYTADGNLQAQFWFNETAPAPTGGGGGWQSVQRTLNTAATAWRGMPDALTIELDLIMDNYRVQGNGGNQPSIEKDLRDFEKMYGLLTSPVGEPPLLILNANGALQWDVVNFPPLQWVIPEPPTYGEVLRNNLGNRVRQQVTVKFMKYTEYDVASKEVSNTARTTPRNKFKPKNTNTTFKQAAAIQYKDAALGQAWAKYCQAKGQGFQAGDIPLSAKSKMKVTLSYDAPAKKTLIAYAKKNGYPTGLK